MNSTADQIMNFGSEWRADALPRLAFSAPGLENRRRNKLKEGGEEGVGRRRKPGERSRERKSLRVKNPIAMDIIEDR